jgi:hypothetical protein
MTILLQNTRTKDYLQSDGSWQREAAYAAIFPDSIQALKFCQRNHLSDVQVVLKFEGTHYDIQIPLKRSADTLPVGAT